MTQIVRVGDNPFSMFKMPDAVASSMTQTANTSAVAVSQNANGVAVATTDDTPKDTIEIAGKKINTKAALAAGGAVVAVAAGLIYAIKTHKLPFFKGKVQKVAEDLSPSTAQKAFQQVANDAGDDIVGEAASGVVKKMTSSPKAVHKPLQESLPLALPPADMEAVQKREMLARAQSAIKHEAKSNSQRVTEAQILRRAQKAKQEQFQAAVQKKVARPELPNVEKALEQASNNSEVKNNSGLPKDAGFALGAFVLGLIVRALSEAKESEGSQRKELKDLLNEKADFIKNIEVPLIKQEGLQYFENYSQNIIPAIEKLQPSIMFAESAAEQAVTLYENINLGMLDDISSENYSLTKNPDTGASVLTVEASEHNSPMTAIFDEKGNLLQLEIYNSFNSETPAIRSRFLRNEAGKTYMSHLIKLNLSTGKVSGTLTFDENKQVKSYLARDREGNLAKVFFIDPNTQELKHVVVPDETGSKCARKYYYDQQGNVVSVSVKPSEGLPERRYKFKDGEVSGLELMDKKGVNPLLYLPLNSEA